MYDQGQILSLKDEMAEVTIQPHGGCESCGMKSACTPEGSTLKLWASNPKGAKTGDVVIVELKPEIKLFGSALVFIFPLAGLFLGLILGKMIGGSDGYGVVGAFAGLILFFAAVRLIDKILSRKFKLTPVITKILNQ